NAALTKFAETLERVCIETVASGKMTKDLAVCVHGDKVTPDQDLNTEAVLDAIDGNLWRALGG
ncbi:MAG: NADP-dependent isocitrate dehydrogenase, partial [Gammaproteobacteria bacterium]|nr:NADP-dependent isocitrate dehydrogenase [Gammaproteobacteria bacterium]